MLIHSLKKQFNVSRRFRQVVLGVTTVYATTMMFVSMIYTINNKRNTRWFHYMTSWNYIIAVVHFIVAFIQHLRHKDHSAERDGESTVIYHAGGTVYGNDAVDHQDNEEGSHLITRDPVKSYGGNADGATTGDDGDSRFHTEPTFVDELHWFLQTTSLLMSSVVVVVYWTLLFKPDELGERPFWWFQSIDRHLIIYVLLLIQYVLSKTPIRLLHAVYALGVAALFFIHTYFYYVATGKLVYHIFDWAKSPGKAIVYFLVLGVMAMVLHLVWFGIDALKHHLGQKSKK